MLKKTKGEYGYITKSKKLDIIKMLIYIGIAAAIFIIGLFLNKMSYQNIFTIVAILFVLPWARAFVEFVVFFPYKTPSRDAYEKVKSTVATEAKLLSDVVITSTEKSMGLDFLVMGNGYVFGVIANEKQNAEEIQKYLRSGVNNWSDLYQVKIHKNVNSFLQDVKNAREKEIKQEEKEKVENYILSLFV
ncbi:MAG: hypothetical protein IIY81_00235 [Lachnospiraceae bacterium]|nr:hypothetical protein [Lachnospiraceae bacterium]